MKKQLFTIFALLICLTTFAQFTTGTVTLSTSPLMTVKIDTDATTVTLTLTGPSNTWLGIGFGGTSMETADDMFIWSTSSNSRDYTSTGQSTPSSDESQSWPFVSENVVSTTRTIVATRPLASLGDYTFLNSSSSIPIIYALSNSTIFSKHNGAKGGRMLMRSALGIEDFSLNNATIYPNPSNGSFRIETKSSLKKITVYSQIGALIKTIELEGASNNNEINLKNLQAGVYLIELQIDSEKTWKKIIIE